jgi:hypothetical protein
VSSIHKLHIVARVDRKGSFHYAAGKAGVSAFSGTVQTASKALLPDLTVGQLTQLTEQSYKPNTLRESKDSNTYYIYIPVLTNSTPKRGDQHDARIK